jgi:Tfp pilus assembly protein PilX
MRLTALSPQQRRGAILAVALATLLVVTLLAGAVFRGYVHSHRQLRREQDQLQAQWLADSALARAVARRTADASYAGETWQVELPQGSGQTGDVSATIQIVPAADQPTEVRVEVEAQFPAADPQGIRVRRVLAIPATGK